MDKETKKKIKEATQSILAEEKMKKRFLKEELDYNYLQYMINRADVNPNLVIDIVMNNGTKITIYTKKEERNGTVIFDDIVAPEDIR